MNNIISIAADFSNDKCYPTAYVVKGDTGDLFNIRLTHDGNDADLSDITLALITFRQGEFSASQEGRIEGSTVSFTLNPACVQIGANLGEVALYHNETLVTTALFCVAVRSSLQDEGTTIPEEESPTLIEFIEKYSGGSGSSKQGDWNQNDTTAADYIKNRPGAYMGDETIYDGTPTTELVDNGLYRAMLSPDFTLTAGNAYRVTFNGTAYVLTAQDKTAETGTVILGELTSDNKPDFTNYPFFIGQGMMLPAELFTETAGTYTLKVESLGTVVVPLDSRFMPAGYATLAQTAHTHANKDTLDKLSDSNGKLQYNGSDVGVQSDWNQNDSTQPDYVKNRPFYTGDPVETVLVEESTVSFAENQGLYRAQFPSTFEATVGETYKVYWDGTTYECACVDVRGKIVIGNLSIVGEGSDTGEPFVMGILNGERIQIVTADTSASHTFSISRFGPEVVKIDPKYIRDMYYTGNPVETVLVKKSTVSFAENQGLYMAEIQSTFEATVGETYKVYWDGAAYECTCVNFNNKPAIGNLSIAGAGSDTGEPFMMVVNERLGITIGTQNTSAFHTVSISGFVSEVVKIDEKYLPNTVATKSEVEAAQTAANNAWTTANNAQTTANNAQTAANNAQTAANNAKSEALDLAARMFGHTSVVASAFYHDKTLSITSLPACIESIGASAFNGCKNLALTSLPSGLTSIGNGAFSDCTKLALTSLPSGLTSIGNGAFNGCKNLALTSLPSGLTSIDSHAFSDCKNLALTSLPSGLTSIGIGAFSGCTKLALTSLPSGLTSIGYSAFLLCTKLALTSLPSGLTSIGNGAFRNCAKLTSITFTGKPTSIENNVFEGCTNLTTINVPWAEGEVANAPWGATNATINYNYTGA